MEKQNKEKILSINMLRFVAAVAVMFYHYIFMFTQRGYTDFDYGTMWSVSHYGYLGVDLFFIISGFVIAMSASDRTLWHFATSRIARLYPIYWSSVIITSIFISFYGASIDTYSTIKNFLTNMTMRPSLFGGTYVDGSYWSLTIELVFYILIGALLLFNKYKYLEKITLFLSVIISIGAITHTIPFNWASYFLAGIIFYFIYKTGATTIRLTSLMLSLIASIIYATYRAPGLSHDYHTTFSAPIISTYIISFYLIFLLISLGIIDRFINNKFNTKVKNFLIILGSLTFPLYLLHQTIGHIILKYLNDIHLQPFTALSLTTVFIILISYALNISVENSGRDIIFKISKTLNNLLFRKSS